MDTNETLHHETPKTSGQLDITQLLTFSVQQGASDLHITAGMPPMIRVDGDVRRIKMPALDHKQVHTLVYDIMNDKQRKEYEENYETDFSFEVPKLARFRVNAFNQHRGAAAVFRTVPSKVLTLEDLDMGKVFRDLAEQARGLVLVTGPTGSGKSTTLAAMVDYVNQTRSEHILTIEDPIEFVHESKKCLINQREVHRDTHSFANALRSALREDPDVILVVRHPAHHLGGQDHRPYHRRLPGGREGHGALHAVRIPAGGHFPDPAQAGQGWSCGGA